MNYINMSFNDIYVCIQVLFCIIIIICNSEYIRLQCDIQCDRLSLIVTVANSVLTYTTNVPTTVLRVQYHYIR